MSIIDNSIQFDTNGKLVHLLGISGVSTQQMDMILQLAAQFIDVNGRLQKSKNLDDMSIANLFFEPSTRTRNAFEIAAKRSSANTINVDVINSSIKKNESLLDTLKTLKAMQVDMFVLRHRQNGMPHYIAKNISNITVATLL